MNIENKYLNFVNVSKYYFINGKKKILFENINLKIPSGKNIGILGKNGSGKSTLLRMIGGIEQPTKGTLKSNINFSWTLALSGGFQNSLTGFDNAKFISRIYGIPDNKLKEKITYIKEFSGLGEDFYNILKTYSSGMKSRLSFSCSIAFDFDYYLIDEIISVGDFEFREKCNKKLNSISNNSNIILVSHELKSLEKYCNYFLVIKENKIIAFENFKKAIEYYEEN